MKKTIAAGYLIVIFFLFFMAPYYGHCGEKDELIVGLKIAPPFVELDENKNPVGFSVDLIKEILLHIDIPRKIKWHVDYDIPSHLKSVIENRVDLAIAATTITSERESHIDFSIPFFKTDLAVLVTGTESRTDIIISFFFSKEFLLIILGIISFLFLAGNLIWVFERDSNFSKNYFKGVLQGMWWALFTLTTVGSGDLYPKHPFGRFIGVIIIVTGLAIFGVAVASLTSMLTVRQLKNAITSPEDLHGHTIAVIKNTNTVDILKRMEIKNKDMVKAVNLEKCLELLDKREVDAVVHDRPMLQYLIKHARSGRYTILDKGFAPAYYGILFPRGSSLRKEVNIALLKAMENEYSYYYKLRLKWFGESG